MPSNNSIMPRDGSGGGPTEDVVILDHLQAGRSFGIMELFEGIPYQHSLIADPWATVYTISKYDLLRNTPTKVLHRLFVDHKRMVSDDRVIQRMRQKSRWNSYKRDLLDDIQQRRNRSKFSVIDRRAPAPRRVGCGDLQAEDVLGVDTSDVKARYRKAEALVSERQYMDACREFHDLFKDFRKLEQEERIWYGRAQTPPRPTYSNKNTHDVYHIRFVNKEDGSKDVDIQPEHRDASLAALDERLVMMKATSRRRERLRRTMQTQQTSGSSGAAEMASATNAESPTSPSSPMSPAEEGDVAAAAPGGANGRRRAGLAASAAPPASAAPRAPLSARLPNRRRPPSASTARPPVPPDQAHPGGGPPPGPPGVDAGADAAARRSVTFGGGGDHPPRATARTRPAGRRTSSLAQAGKRRLELDAGAAAV